MVKLGSFIGLVIRGQKGNGRSLESPESLEKRKVVVVFTIYGHGGHLGHVTWIFINISSPFLKKLQIKFDIEWSRGSRGDV